jgi:tetratricopeptide (TPR) repeat protein
VNDFLQNDLLSQASSEAQEKSGFAPNPQLTIREALDRASERIGNRFKDQPLVEAAIRKTIGSAYTGLGEWKLAVPHLERSVELRKRLLGPDNDLTIDSLNNLAWAYMETDRASNSVPIFEEVLKANKARLGPEAPKTLSSMSDLALAYGLVKRSSDAIQLFQDALIMQRTNKVAATNGDLFSTMNNLAVIYDRNGRRPEAIPLYEELLKLQKAATRADDQDTLRAIINLAFDYSQSNRLAEAIPLYEETLRLWTVAFGISHPDTLRTLNELADAYTKAGRTGDAIALLERNLAEMKAKLGPDNPVTLGVMLNLANAYYSAGRLTNAIPLYEETVKLDKATLGPDHPDTLRSMNALAVAYDNAGRSQEALPLLEAILKLRQSKLGPDHPNTLRSMNNLALTYEDAGRLAEAVPLFEEELNLQKAKLGPDHPDTLITMRWLAYAYQDAGRSADADRVFSAVLTPAFMSQPKSSGVLRTRGEFHARFGRWEKAAADLSHALDLQPDHVWTWHCLAAVQVQEGQVEAYRNLCAKSIERFGNTTDPVTAERIAKDSLILPASGADLDRVASMAHTASSSTNHPYGAAWNQLTQGLADYRQGHFASAADWAGKALESVGTNSERDVSAYMVKAMAWRQLNKSDEARTALAKGSELAATKLAKLDGADLGGYWLDWVFAQALLREAATLIEGQTPSVKDASK